MTARRVFRSPSYILIAALVLGTFVVAAFLAERMRNDSEAYVVYSAYLSNEILEDAHDWSVDGPIEVVVTDATKVGNQRWRGLYFLDFRRKFEHMDRTTNYSFLVRNLFSTKVADRFHLPPRVTVSIISELEVTSADFTQCHPRALGYITVSGVGFNASHTEAVFYIDHFCGLCGGGGYVLMHKVKGRWAVADEHGTWIS